VYKNNAIAHSVRYAKCHILFVVMLSVVMPDVVGPFHQHNNTAIMQQFVMLGLFFIVMLCVVMLSVIMLSVIMLSVIMLSVIMLSVIMLSVILLNVIGLFPATIISHCSICRIKFSSLAKYGKTFLL
jgi:hypothetical protein